MPKKFIIQEYIIHPQNNKGTDIFKDYNYSRVTTAECIFFEWLLFDYSPDDEYEDILIAQSIRPHGCKSSCINEMSLIRQAEDSVYWVRLVDCSEEKL